MIELRIIDIRVLSGSIHGVESIGSIGSIAAFLVDWQIHILGR